MQRNTNDKKIKTIPGISKWFVWDWPISGETVGYVRARSLPNIGNWTEFSPASISTFCGNINRPNPEYTTPTRPKTPWLTSSLVKKVHRSEMQNSLQNEANQIRTDSEFPLRGWIGRYSASSKKEMSEKALEENVISEESTYYEKANTENTNYKLNKTRKQQKIS
ncbi:unnamed protein product [Rhizophagus irregularis]|nr:unnamed protein product [Rhizophagus irregularis]